MTEELKQAAPRNHGPIQETDLYDFAGWLTTRPGVMTAGRSCEVGPLSEAVAEYIKTFPERFALTQRPTAQAGEREAKCKACNGHGLVGGHMQDGSGYGEGCPDCNPEPAPLVKWASTKPAAQATPGALAGAWDEGYRLGVEDERTSEANIGVAGFGAKVNPARQNPYRAQQATPEPVGEPFGYVVTSTFYGTCTFSKTKPGDLDGDAKAVEVFTHPAPGVPEGFVLVPIEPTPEMENAFRQAFTNQLHKRRNQWGRAKHTMSAEGAGLRAMLAAAQAKGGE